MNKQNLKAQILARGLWLSSCVSLCVEGDSISEQAGSGQVPGSSEPCFHFTPVGAMSPGAICTIKGCLNFQRAHSAFLEGKAWKHSSWRADMHVGFLCDFNTVYRQGPTELTASEFPWPRGL